MTRSLLTVSAAAALLAGCASGYDDARSPEAGTAGVYRNEALNPPPVGPVDHTSSVGTQGVHGTDVPPPSGTVKDAYGRPVVAAPAAPMYYDAYGRPFYYDAYGRPVLVRP
jgi:hypothetical protein